jgi:putative endonuclease
MNFWTYIVTNKKYGTLYIGYTDEIYRRTYEHKQKIIAGFTKKYGLNKLVYYEPHETREQAKIREKQIKEWKRDWKINLIENFNPHWQDLLSSLDQELSCGIMDPNLRRG